MRSSRQQKHVQEEVSRIASRSNSGKDVDEAPLWSYGQTSGKCARRRRYGDALDPSHGIHK